MGSFVRALTLVASVSLVPVLAAAQAPTAPDASAAAIAAPAMDGDAPATPSKPVVPATGYSFGASSARTTPRVERARVQVGHPNSVGTNATVAGFETLGDGSTRLFVELSKPALYDTKPGRSSVTYVLKGVRVGRRNDQNPLVTVHFNTPMTRARLAPHGRDLWLVVDLRASVQPATTMEAMKDGAAKLRVEFPKGEYLPVPSEAASAVAPNEPVSPPGTIVLSAKSAPTAAP